MDYFRANSDEIISWFGWHAQLSALPLLIGLLIALPLGWLARRYRWLYPPLVTVAGLLYTIPSLALFILLPGLLKTRILD
ncbi:MAG: ABC transporter permease, partial [Jatrophihabitantaceae bacterium]